MKTVIEQPEESVLAAAPVTFERTSKERYKRALLTSLSALTARAIGFLCQLISVRLTLGYLGTERYGMWLTISSFSAFLAFADLGMSNGLLNVLSAADGKDDRAASRAYVSAAALILSTVSIIIIVFSLTAYPFVPWHRIFNVSSPRAISESAPSVVVYLLIFALGLPLSIVQRVQLAYQEGYATNVWQVCGSVLSVVAVAWGISAHISLPYLVICLTAGPLFAGCLNSAVQFYVSRPWLRPALSAVTTRATTYLLKTGASFVVIQLLMTATTAFDNVLVAQLVGPRAVSGYGVPLQLFSITSVLTMLVLMPFWPAYSEALASSDVRWVKRALKRCMVAAALISGLSSVTLALFGKWILRVWLGRPADAPTMLFWGLAASTIVICSTHPIGILLMAMNRLKFSIITGAAIVPISLVAKILAIKTFGVAGVPWAQATAYFTLITVPSVVYFQQRIRNELL